MLGLLAVVDVIVVVEADEPAADGGRGHPRPHALCLLDEHPDPSQALDQPGANQIDQPAARDGLHQREDAEQLHGRALLGRERAVERRRQPGHLVHVVLVAQVAAQVAEVEERVLDAAGERQAVRRGVASLAQHRGELLADLGQDRGAPGAGRDRA